MEACQPGILPGRRLGHGLTGKRLAGKGEGRGRKVKYFTFAPDGRLAIVYALTQVSNRLRYMVGPVGKDLYRAYISLTYGRKLDLALCNESELSA